MISVAIVNSVESVLAGLTPVERWSAARRFEGDVGNGRLVILICVVVLVVLVGTLLVVSLNRILKERKNKDKLFSENSRRRGLSRREVRLLLAVAQQAGLKRAESIFTMSGAFGIGAMRVAKDGVDGKGGQSDELKKEIALLREKLGFGSKVGSSSKASDESGRLTTHEIPVGRKLYASRRQGGHGSADVECTVVRNSASELGVRLSEALKIVFGELWCVRYYSGTSVWEFDSSVVSYDGDTLVLDHSDEVRYVNRRRFLRVSVRLRAYLAHFPFVSPFAGSAGEDAGEGVAGSDSWAPPRFVPAVVTELAGPGLLVESALEVAAGERVLVVFSLYDEASGGSIEVEGEGGSRRVKIAEDIGEVRHVNSVEGGYSMAVELTGLSESDVDELIRATNAACFRANGKEKEAVSVGEQAAGVSAAHGV
ncbi:MAG: hypothetical protein JW720_02485 [Sedimentisphaerales bacterium]|nr:hypothetical protein [Sedimentisphaerales bacterium]